VTSMRKIFIWVVRIAVLVVLIKVVMWSWDKYQGGGQSSQASEVLEMDKVCRITNPDFGSCVCVHRRTNEKLSIPYEECVQRARSN